MQYDVFQAVGADGGEMGFTAAAASLEVPLGGIVTPIAFVNAAGQSWFEPGDNLLLQAIWPALPFQFGQGTGGHYIALEWFENGGTTDIVPELANSLGSSLIYLPSGCEPLQVEDGANPPGLFVKVPTNLGGGPNRVQLRIVQAVLNVSMINLPAVLDGEALAMSYFFELKHTLPASVTP